MPYVQGHYSHVPLCCVQFVLRRQMSHSTCFTSAAYFHRKRVQIARWDYTRRHRLEALPIMLPPGLYSLAQLGDCILHPRPNRPSLATPLHKFKSIDNHKLLLVRRKYLHQAIQHGVGRRYWMTKPIVRLLIWYMICLLAARRIRLSVSACIGWAYIPLWHRYCPIQSFAAIETVECCCTVMSPISIAIYSKCPD